MGLVEMEATTIKGMISDGVKFNFIRKNVFLNVSLFTFINTLNPLHKTIGYVTGP